MVTIYMISGDVFENAEVTSMGQTLASFYATRLHTKNESRKFYTAPLTSIAFIEQEKKP